MTAAKAQPGKLNWAATPGLPVYVLLALQRQAGIEMANVPYRDFAPAYQDLNQGRLHVIGTGVPTQVAHHRAGTAKLLFVTNNERAPQVPDVPTAREAGYPDLTFEGVSGIYGWRDMPLEIAKRMVADVGAIVADPDFRARVLKVGTVPRSGTQEQFVAAIEGQRAQIAAIHAAMAKKRSHEALYFGRALPSLGVAHAGGNAMRIIFPIAAIIAGAVASFALLIPSQAPAQSWPQRPVRFIIPFGPGAGADIGARLIQERLQKRWGQPVVIENRPGGDSIIAIQAVLSANDDHTFLWGPSGNFIVHPFQYKKLSYNPDDIIPVARFSSTIRESVYRRR